MTALLDGLQKLLEKITRVVRAGGVLGVVLYRERLVTWGLEAFAGSVVQVQVSHLDAFR
jgi:hypothetical protein